MKRSKVVGSALAVLAAVVLSGCHGSPSTSIDTGPGLAILDTTPYTEDFASLGAGDAVGSEMFTLYVATLERPVEHQATVNE